MDTFQKPEPLGITCTSTDCGNNLHCFLQLQKMTPDQRGKCRVCGADLVDWPRVHRRKIRDAKNTFKALQCERIRHHYFHRDIDIKAINHAKRKGRIQLMQSARTRLEKYLAPADPPRDGIQTPKKDNSIYYAQHATATCCRKCLEYWHDIPKGWPLTQEQTEYCFELIELFLDERLPDLADEPMKVPPLRH